MTRFLCAFFLLFSLVFADPILAQESLPSVTSPDGSIRVDFNYNSLNDFYVFTVTRHQTVVFEDSFMGIRGTDIADNYTSGLTLTNNQIEAINDTYSLPTGKTINYVNQANELTLTFQNSQGLYVDYIFRVYNDGIAFRYQIPLMEVAQISVDDSAFNLPDDAILWAQNLQFNYERQYSRRTIAEVNNQPLGFPILAEIDANTWTLIGEVASNLGDYTSSHVISYNPQGILIFQPATDDPNSIPVQAPFTSPWRYAIIGDLGDIVESTLTENISDPNPQLDSSWIKPGRVAWSWWSDPSSPSSLQTQKDYVDFAASMGWEYVLVDEGWNSSWVPELVSYANSQNVDIILWYFYGGNFSGWTPEGWIPGYTNALSTFNRLKNWGVAGAKIDFFDSDSKTTNQIKQEILRAAQDTQMVVNFHGASFPKGERRSWPHLLTKEGVQGAEHRGLPANHNINLVFTRNVIGSMDYTPVTFSNKGTTTNAHQLAQAVMFESGQQHYADSIASYQAQPQAVQDLLKIIPTTWDETKFIEGAPGEYVALARRKGNDWFVAAFSINQRSILFPVSGLSSNTFDANFYVDGTTADDIITYSETLNQSDVVGFDLNTNGGAVVHLVSTGNPNSPTPTPTPTACQMADINQDGIVDLTDYSLLASNFLSTSPTVPRADINTDGIVDLTDYSLLASQFLQQCTGPLATPTPTPLPNYQQTVLTNQAQDNGYVALQPVLARSVSYAGEQFLVLTLDIKGLTNCEPSTPQACTIVPSYFYLKNDTTGYSNMAAWYGAVADQIQTDGFSALYVQDLSEYRKDIMFKLPQENSELYIQFINQANDTLSFPLNLSGL